MKWALLAIGLLFTAVTAGVAVGVVALAHEGQVQIVSPGSETKEDKTEQQIARYTAYLFWATLCLAACTLFLWLSTRKLAKDAEKIGVDNAKMNRDTERGRIFVVVDTHNFGRALAPYNPNVNPHAGYQATQLEIKFHFKNYGKTPVVIREVAYSEFIFAERKPEHIAFTVRPLGFSEFMLGPESPSDEITYQGREVVGREDGSEVCRGLRRIYFYVRVDYVDAFGDAQMGRFILEFVVINDEDVLRLLEYSAT